MQDLKVTEYTPRRNGNSKKGNGVVTEAERLRQEGHQTINSQSKRIDQLMSDHAKLLAQIGSVTCGDKDLTQEGDGLAGLLVHIHSLHAELDCLSSHYHSSSPDGSSLLTDLERLTRKNAELCNALASMQCSRTGLERDLVVLKRAFIEERTKTELDAQSLVEENRLLWSENDKLKIQLKENMRRKDKELETCKKEIDKLRQSQLNEIDLRCREVDNLKDQLSNQLETLQMDRELLSNQVEQLKLEKKRLVQDVSRLESKVQMTSEQSEHKMTRLLQEKEAIQIHKVTRLETLLGQQVQSQRHLKDKLYASQESKENLTRMVEEISSKNASLLAETESAQVSSTMAEKQVAKAQAEAEETRKQVRSLSELNVEMKLLLEQRACRIQHLEKLLRKREEPSNFNGLSSNFVSSPKNGQLAAFEVDLFKLRQQLSQSKQENLQLEVKQTRLRSEKAKLSGSYQALLVTREKLDKENSTSVLKSKDLQMRNKVLMQDKEFLLEKLETLSRECVQLSTGQHFANNELVKVCKLREDDAKEFASQLQVIQEMQHSCDVAVIVQSQMHHFNALLRNDVAVLEDVEVKYAGFIKVGVQQVSDLEERISHCLAASSTQQLQLDVCDGTSAVLQGELEVLRSRKMALLSVAKSRPHSTAARHHVRQRLKIQQKKNDYLRVKLGYALSELRSYRRQKLTIVKKT